MRRPLVIAVICGACSVMLGMGIRQSFGLFLTPVSESLGTGRETYSLAMAISNIIFGLPLVAMLADRIGARWVLLGGGLLYAAGLVLMATITTTIGLYLSVGLVIGIALSATTFVTVFGAIGQMVPDASRSRVFGTITSIGSSGMFIVPPLAQYLISNYGWQSALTALAGVAGLIMLLAFGLPGKANLQTNERGGTVADEPFLQVLKKARGHTGYLLLTAGFFVCGFHVAFIATHLPAFLRDQQLPAYVGAWALSLIGVFNMIGSYLFGWLGDRFRKKHLLSLLYFARAIVISLFLFFPITQVSALLFAGTIGFLWLATVPLTSGTVAQIFGTRYLATLYGIVFLSHQVGSFLGVWLGGRFYDATGSYTPVWLMAVALGIFAALVHMPITDRPIAEKGEVLQPV